MRTLNLVSVVLWSTVSGRSNGGAVTRKAPPAGFWNLPGLRVPARRGRGELHVNHVLSRLQYALRRHRAAVEALVAVIGTIGVVTAAVRWLPASQAEKVVDSVVTVWAAVLAAASAALVADWLKRRGA